MNHRHHTTLRLSALISILLTLAFTSSAQMTSSPYSKYGYGILGDNATSAQRQMGSTGYAMHSGRQINAMNPASYAAMDTLTFLFDIGADATLFWRNDDSGSQRDWGGGIDYITLQAPLSRTVGFSAGLVPYSSVGYSFGSGIENGAASHQGNGGINQLYVGTGWQPVKGLSIGFNVSYIFGNITNDVFASSNMGQSAVFEQVMEIRDYHFRFGAQYTQRINRLNSVTLGVTYEPGKSLLGKTYVLKYLQSSGAGADTIAPGVIDLHHRFELASSYGIGLAYDHADRFHGEIDFTYQPWGKAKYTQLENFSATRLANRWKVGAGISYTPNPRGGYLRRIAYRAGAYYNRDYIMVGENHVRDYAISCGFGFPTVSTKTVVNLGFEYRNRRATPMPMLKEQYFNITLGVNFNQVWFFRNKLR
ncbi:MAG: hypothetical protein NC339_02305 [Muribaculaceae bacterium]|nr:hypothetical protein [Muribaculaceae bacterium]